MRYLWELKVKNKNWRFPFFLGEAIERYVWPWMRWELDWWFSLRLPPLNGEKGPAGDASLLNWGRAELRASSSCAVYIQTRERQSRSSCLPFPAPYASWTFRFSPVFNSKNNPTSEAVRDCLFDNLHTTYIRRVMLTKTSVGIGLLKRKDYLNWIQIHFIAWITKKSIPN